MSERLKELAALECANQFAANRSMAVDREWVRGWDACIDYVRAALSTDAASPAQAEPTYRLRSHGDVSAADIAAQAVRAIEQDFPGVGCACNGDCDETGVCPLLGAQVTTPRAQRTLDALMAGDKEALPVELHEYVDALYWHRRVRMLRAAGLPPHKEPS